ncbi:hypothetical protein PRUPE_4G251100 [Prunus persica]|uniref:Uncharacterized protein n=1 Tax=Prunus persica TaxID=3760 RepID=M5WLW3_PRUPE|nr:hypothetical protein PRUPE_4G251100 [Prunus persica]
MDKMENPLGWIHESVRNYELNHKESLQPAIQSREREIPSVAVKTYITPSFNPSSSSSPWVAHAGLQRQQRPSCLVMAGGHCKSPIQVENRRNQALWCRGPYRSQTRRLRDGVVLHVHELGILVADEGEELSSAEAEAVVARTD